MNSSVVEGEAASSSATAAESDRIPICHRPTGTAADAPSVGLDVPIGVNSSHQSQGPLGVRRSSGTIFLLFRAQNTIGLVL
jgi:hypothetical protein